jgi:hypothetical protein
LNHTGTSNVTYDLTSNTLSNVAIQAYGDNLTVKINSADAVGVTRFATAYANGLLVAADATLDLSHTQVSGFRVTSTNGLGTAFTVSDLGTAGQIAGGPGHDTIVAQGSPSPPISATPSSQSPRWRRLSTAAERI